MSRQTSYHMTETTGRQELSGQQGGGQGVLMLWLVKDGLGEDW